MRPRTQLPLLILLVVIGLTACHRPEIPTVALPKAIATPGPAKKQATPITEIHLERNPGWSRTPRPWYGLTLRSNGTATYIGAFHAPRTGTYHASISCDAFDRLAQQIITSGFLNYASFYGPAADDIPEARVSVMHQGQRKTVVDWGRPFQPQYELTPPPALGQIEQAVDAVVANAHWLKSSDKTDLPRYLP